MLQRHCRDSERPAETFWASICAGIGAVLVGGLLLGMVYAFMPISRAIVKEHPSYVLMGAIALFLVGFGMSLQFALELQFLRGKWK